MKIVVIGGTGLIGSKAIAILRAAGHDAVAAAPSTGVNTVTGQGLDESLVGAQVVIDLANSPSFEPTAVLDFFSRHENNLLAAEARAGVRHHVVVSIVGTGRFDNGYFRGKVAQEALIKASTVPHTIIRSTQFMEFLGSIADDGQQDGKIHIATGLFQPIAADDVAAIVAEVALSEPSNATLEIAGPERAPFNEIVGRYLAGMDDPRPVVADPDARYFGSRVEYDSLVPQGEARLGDIDLTEWLARKRRAMATASA
jgi:uncharacterized protein YbjT (DUF2867 family)